MSVDRIGKYTVLGTLGAGAHSQIVRVRREADGLEYALKLVPIESDADKKYLDQAKHEYRVGRMLDHPNVVGVYCLETDTDWLFRVKRAKLLLEYVPGVTLDRAKLLNPARMLRVFERVAAGLTYMHKRGVIHADLKPGNILLGPRLGVKLIDLGLARVKDDPPKDRVQGTREYLAPETATHKIISERTDIYNFGATMYRLVTFQLPPEVAPEGGMPLDEKAFVKRFTPVKELNPGASRDLCDLIERCLSFNALKRPERMSEVQGTLDRLADEAAEKFGPPEDEE